MENLREKRLEQGHTQTDMARSVGVSLTAYLLWERGVGNPNPENRKRLEAVLAKEKSNDPE